MISTREIAAEYRLSHWSQIMQERAASGMSIKAYCESIGIRQNVYHYWQRKLREVADMNVQDETTDIIPHTPQGNYPSTPSGWAICETKNTETPVNTQNTIQIEIGKSRVTAETNTDQELLAAVCKMLMSLC